MTFGTESVAKDSKTFAGWARTQVNTCILNLFFKHDKPLIQKYLAKQFLISIQNNSKRIEYISM